MSRIPRPLVRIPFTEPRARPCGRCVCEEELCTELLARLAVFPRMKSTLVSLGLQPKLLSLTTGKETEEVELQLESTELQGRINQVIARIGKAKFTGQDDAQLVPGLYKDFVEKITSKLQDTLALGGGAETQNDSVARSGSAGAVVVASLHPADAQLLLLPNAASRRDDGVEGTLTLCRSDGQRLRPALAQQLAESTLKKRPTGKQLQQLGAQADIGEPTFDGCSQRILPWRPPTAAEWNTLVRLLDALRDLNAQSLGASKSVAKKALAGAAELLQTISDQASPPLAEEIRHVVQELRRQKGPVTTEQLNRVAVPLLGAAGATGWRRYNAGQELVIRMDGQWIDAKVVGVKEPNSTKHHLHMHEGREGVLELHPWNHALRELPYADFHEALGEWKASLRKDYAHIFDAVLGRPLDVLEQCVTIDVAGNAADLVGVRDVGGLSAWLHQLHQQRCQGTEATAPTAALLTGPPAAGKVSGSWSNLSQVHRLTRAVLRQASRSACADVAAQSSHRAHAQPGRHRARPHPCQGAAAAEAAARRARRVRDGVELDRCLPPLRAQRAHVPDAAPGNGVAPCAAPARRPR